MTDGHQDYRPPSKTNTLAIASFVSSFFISVAGIVLGHLALRQIKERKEDGRGLAIAGLVIGYISAAITVVGITVFFGTFVVLASTAPGNSGSNSGSVAVSSPTMDALDKQDQPVTPAPTEAGPSVPAASLSENRDWNGTITLNGQAMGIVLEGAKAPQGVAVFTTLANHGYFNGTSCHRLTTGGFDLLQCGDPTGTGTGNPGYKFGPIENAPADNVYKRGDLALARQGNDANSNGSQFFIVYQDTTIPADSAGGYSVIGHVVSGLDAVDKVAAGGVKGGSSDGPPALPAVIESFTAK